MQHSDSTLHELYLKLVIEHVGISQPLCQLVKLLLELPRRLLLLRCRFLFQLPASFAPSIPAYSIDEEERGKWEGRAIDKLQRGGEVGGGLGGEFVDREEGERAGGEGCGCNVGRLVGTSCRFIASLAAASSFSARACSLCCVENILQSADIAHLTTERLPSTCRESGEGRGRGERKERMGSHAK